MSEFESVIIEKFKSKILSDIDEVNLVTITEREKLKVPHDIIKECWELVNTENLKSRIVKRVEVLVEDLVVEYLSKSIEKKIKRQLAENNVGIDDLYKKILSNGD